MPLDDPIRLGMTLTQVEALQQSDSLRGLREIKGHPSLKVYVGQLPHYMGRGVVDYTLYFAMRSGELRVQTILLFPEPNYKSNSRPMPISL